MHDDVQMHAASYSAISKRVQETLGSSRFGEQNAAAQMRDLIM